MSRIRTRQFIPALLLMAALVPSVTAAQSGQTTPAPQPKPSPTTSDAKPLVQLRVQVTISRYTGEKKTTSLPFTLWVTADSGTTRLNAGQNIEIPTTTFKGDSGTPVPSYTSRSVGTQIMCSATSTADGRFRVELQIGDSYLSPSKTEAGMATIKSLGTTNALLLRDGQTAEFASSTDMISGEVTRIDVTVTTLK